MAIDEHMQLLSHMLERAQHYNGAIIAGGYTAFFAAWAFFQNQYQSPWYDVSLLLMLLSVAVFVLWNVFSNIVMGNDLFRKAETIARNIHDPIYLYEALASLDRELLERTMHRKRWWRIMLYLSIVPGLTAALIYFSTVGAGIFDRLYADG